MESQPKPVLNAWPSSRASALLQVCGWRIPRLTQSIVGARLPANAFFQPSRVLLTQRLRGQARSYRFVDDVYFRA